MANPEQKPDVKTFCTDPRFQADRELLSGYLEFELNRRAEEASKKPKAENIFDRLFGVASGEPQPSVFDLPFLPRK